MLSREIACTIFFFKVFGMTRPGIEPRPTAYKASILPLGHFIFLELFTPLDTYSEPQFHLPIVALFYSLLTIFFNSLQVYWSHHLCSVSSPLLLFIFVINFQLFFVVSNSLRYIKLRSSFFIKLFISRFSV